jgi:hypothetical protein
MEMPSLESAVNEFLKCIPQANLLRPATSLQTTIGAAIAYAQPTRNIRATQQKAVRERLADAENGERLGARIHSFCGPAVVQ